MILIFSFFYTQVEGKDNKVLKFSCKFDPNLIKQEEKKNGFLEFEKVNRSQICEFLSCEDTLEISVSGSKSDTRSEFRLRNTWFDHQGILLDDFLINENNVSITTFLSQAYFLESYFINKNTGEAIRKFYRFNDPDLYYEIKKIEKSLSEDSQFYNEKGKISLKSLKSYSLEPAEVFHFEGKCYEGVGV